MKLLKPIISRIVDNIEVINRSKHMGDEDALNLLLSSGVKIESISKEFQGYYGIEFIDIQNTKIDKELLEKFDRTTLRKENVIPISEDKEKKEFHFAIGDIANTRSRNAVDRASRSIGYRVKYSFAISKHIDDKYEKTEEETLEVIPKPLEVDDEDFNAREWFENILNKGIDLGASDIHIEQFDKQVKIRYRVDGELATYDKHSFTEGQISNINVIVKMTSSLDISEKRKPQDGRIDDYEYGESKYDLRVSSVSTINGEKFTFRIFEKTAKVLSFEDLGFSKENKKIAKKILGNQNGIMYLAGATGSGKTTTLYTMIDSKNTDKVNIYTIENPVEKTIDDVNQIQINELAGVSYASTLRALLRQDPDIIVVGETRDRETTELSVRASLTGHLVLTTIHANNALDSISRVIDMGIEPYLIGASSIGFLSQRLVKKLCIHCKEKHSLEDFEKEWLRDKMKENYIEDDIDLDSLEIFRAAGCEECNSGYKDRIAVVEIMEMNDTLKNLISNGVNIADKKNELIRQGFKPLIVDGINKVVEGVTTIEEIMKEIN